MCSALIALAGASAFAATVYKWVDEKGVTHYSDQPHENAQAVDVKSAQTYQSPGVAAPVSSGTPANNQPAVVYRTCELYRPENDEVFLNTDTVVAKLRLDPPQLRGGDRIAMGLDGKRITTSGSSETTLKVERGSHSLMAIVEDASGKAVCSSPTVTFHVRQPSVQAPNRANRPRF
jgi:Domain of unknown function (DUF4124)